MKIKVIEIQGRPHTLTQKDGKTFRLLAREEKIVDESVISNDFLAEQDMSNILLVSVEDGESKKSKGGNK